MDMPDIPSGRSTQRELQLHGPRPMLLKVRKDSHKIRKPPVAPPPSAEARPHHHPPPPVIIYTESPKIIHVNPDEFKSVVQRLTGPNSSSSKLNISPPSTSASSSDIFFQENGGGISPAASTSGQFPGMLSQNPISLPPIPHDAFPESSDSNTDLHSNRNENSLVMPNLISPTMMNTPSPNNVDIFSTLFDL